MRVALAAGAVSSGMPGAPAWAAELPAASAELGAADDVMLPAPTPLTAPQTLYLDVTLNGSPRGLLPFTELAGQLRADPLVLRQPGVMLAVGDTLVVGQGGRMAGLNPLNGTSRWEAPIATARGITPRPAYCWSIQ